MTSPATKNVIPSANRYHGSRVWGFHSRTAIRIAIGEEIAIRLKIGPRRRPGTNRYAAVTMMPPMEYANQARCFTRWVSGSRAPRL